MSKTGYNAVQWMRERPEDRRGGQAKPDDGFVCGGPTLAARTDEYLTTAIYTEASIVQLQAVHARCHPAERPSDTQTLSSPNQKSDAGRGKLLTFISAVGY